MTKGRAEKFATCRLSRQQSPQIGTSSTDIVVHASSTSGTSKDPATQNQPHSPFLPTADSAFAPLTPSYHPIYSSPPISNHEVSPKLPMYVPPGQMEEAREGWWNWILKTCSTDRTHASHQVINMCRDLCVILFCSICLSV